MDSNMTDKEIIRELINDARDAWVGALIEGDKRKGAEKKEELRQTVYDFYDDVRVRQKVFDRVIRETVDILDEVKGQV